MSSHKGKGRNQGRGPRRGPSRDRWFGFLNFESLENRVLLSTTPWKPTSSNLADVQNGPMANAGADLINVYQAYLKGGDLTQVASEFPQIEFQAGLVGVDVKWNGSGSFSSYTSSLQSLGMNVTAQGPNVGIVEGFLPIAQLPTVAEDPQTLALAPIYTPSLSYEGIANNEADQALKADVASAQFGVTGAGVTIGVLSDSVNQAANLNGLPKGLAGSYQTGDLAPNSVNVLTDGVAGDTDEGRAMLENIHDIAPGAGLAFDTADGGELTFAQHIVALQSQAGASVIADDIGYADEPMFQDGLVSQAVNTVVANGATYLSAAGNAANDGYLSQFRGVQATVGSIGAGTFMNFNPSAGGAVTTELPIIVNQAGGDISFEFSQPFAFQEPSGDPNVVTSQMNIYVLDSSGNVVMVGNSDNVAQQMPFQFISGLAAGSYSVAIQLVSGPAPSNVEFVQFGDSQITVAQQFGTAGGTSYPTTYGHAAAAATIGIGAVPWWSATPFLGENPLNSEPFSSFGPALSLFNPDGSAKSPQVVQNPTVSGPDGGNTSFFGEVTDTSNPATLFPATTGLPAPFNTPTLPGQPVTSSNLSQANLPSFFGTSSATPNVAAVVALMKQLNPTLSQAQIKQDLIASAETQPLNGNSAGTWEQDGGYGLVNATAALNAANALSVTAETPGNGQTITLSPSVVQLTFNTPVNFSTVSASDLIFSALPPGVSITVGSPIAVNNPTDPTVIAFPITIHRSGTLANGSYNYSLQGGIIAQNGKVLIPFSGAFNLQDANGPRITSTSVNGRIVTVQFNSGVDPSTINVNTLQLWRANGGAFGQASNVLVSALPGVVFNYNPLTQAATIDLSQVPQSELPTDDYAIVVQGSPTGNPSVLDQAGVPLDGEYNNTFPSGNGTPGGTFAQDLGVQNLVAPTITAITMDPASYAPGSYSASVQNEDTNNPTPVFDGQVSANFPGSLAGLTVVAEFSSLHGGNIDLTVGAGGRGFSGNFDVVTTTDANGRFVIQAPALPEGFSTMRVVVIGAPDSPPQAGFASTADLNFRIDETAPGIGLTWTGTPTVPLTAVSITPGGTALPLSGTNLPSLSTLSLDVVDPSNPTSGALSTPAQVIYPAVDPSSADNVASYRLINTSTGVDYSSYIVSANFVQTDNTFGQGTTPNRVNNSFPNVGRIDLTFNAGLPAGTYQLIALSASSSSATTGLKDAAGNPMNNGWSQGTTYFTFSFNLSPQPVFITSVALQNSYGQANSTVIGGADSYFAVPASGSAARAPAPPTAFIINLSTPLNPGVNYTPDVLLVGSANSVGGTPDGSFGQLGEGGLGTSGTGFSVVPNTTVTLVDAANPSLTPGEAGFVGTQLVLQLAPGTSLKPDYYRLYLPNTGSTAITDIYGHQLDGEALGYLATTDNYVLNLNANNGTGFDGYTTSSPTSNGPFAPATYNDLLTDGVVNTNEMSGDGVAGGAFMAGFTVAANTSILYANPTYVENPLVPSTISNGSPSNPYPVLASQAAPGTPNATSSNVGNFFNFNPNYDRAGIGRYADSAFVAAASLASTGPVIIAAFAGTPQTNPVTGQVTTNAYVLQAPAGSNPAINDGSASIPADTQLLMEPGSVLKLMNASLFVQNQGSALQALGTTSSHVVFTSYDDSSVGNGSNGSGGSPDGADWGGIVFRNYDQAANGGTFPVDGTLTAANGSAAVTGADDLLSRLNFAEVRYAGGAVPATQGIRYDAVTLYDSRPTLTNDTIYIPNGDTNGAQAAISGDLDSFREDDAARGPLIRATTVANYSLNGIWVRPNLSSGITGVAEATNAIPLPVNPTTLGGNVNFTFDDPLPYILTSQLLIGEEMLTNTGGQTEFTNNRLYIQPGMMVKSAKGAGIAVVNGGTLNSTTEAVNPNSAASLNVGSRAYINQYDANPNFAASDPNFQSEGTSDPLVLFTSLYDAAASTTTTDPITGATIVVVPAINSANAVFNSSTGQYTGQPVLTDPNYQGYWGSVGIQSGAVAVINDATFEYGGGEVDSPQGTEPAQSVLAFITDTTLLTTPLTTGFDDLFSPLAQLGTHVMVTNNNFFDNFDTPMQIEPNGLLAADPLRPLESGNPFFRSNLMQGTVNGVPIDNGIDGISVIANRGAFFQVTNANTANAQQTYAMEETNLGNGNVNLTVNSVWDSTDLTYVLRGTIVLAGAYDGLTNGAYVPGTTFGAEPTPFITLTLQSALPGTLLANGQSIASPGESLVVKTLNDFTGTGGNNVPWPVVATYGSSGASAVTGAAVDGGAGFIVGVDDGVDPPTSPVVDPGVQSQIRILGIAGNTSTGQSRVPVVITSLRDDSVGVTVRGVAEDNIFHRDILAPVGYNYTTPAPGDGGYIYVGGNSLTDYNLEDPRDGSLIDNANISYMNSIQLQGGGIVYTDPTGAGGLVTKLGQTPATQYNSAMAMTISDSNLSNFLLAAVYAHPDAGAALDVTASSTGTSFPIRDTKSLRGEGVVLYMVNDTISNSTIGVLANADTVAPTDQPSPIQVVLLNNTFYNNPIGLETNAPVLNPTSFPVEDSVYWLAMDNIFSNSSIAAIQATGQEYQSQGQYNLFWANTANTSFITPAPAELLGNFGAVFGNPQFVDAAAGNFSLLPNSAAIDASRSEFGPVAGGDAIFPAVNPVYTSVGGIRTDPSTLPAGETPGRSNPAGGAATITDPRKQVTLPGTPGQSVVAGQVFNNEWVAALPGSSGAIAGPASNSATWDYTPITGERDLTGQFRVDDPNVPNIGFGTRPYFDIGANEYVIYNPPEVVAYSSSTNVQVQLASGATSDLYTVGSVSGVNQVPNNIQIKFNQALDPSTLSALSVLLVGSGGDGTFGNGNDIDYSLAGRISFNASTLVMTITTAGLTLPSDEYEITLEGTGSNVVKSAAGLALNGANTTNGSPNGAQQTLPSGSAIYPPGSNFYLQFTLSTTAPSIVPGTFHMTAATDTGASNSDAITNDTTPSWTGQIAVHFPDQLAGSTVFLDAFNFSTGQWVQVGQATTNASGVFTVTPSAPLNPAIYSPYIVGADGLISSNGRIDPGVLNPGAVRVRIVDPAGNASNLPTDPIAAFANKGAAAEYIIDTSSPTVSGYTPTPGTLDSSSSLTVSFVANKNLSQASLNASSILMVTAGPDGVLGDNDDVPVSLAGVNFTLTPLGGGPLGPEEVSFNVPAPANGLYMVVLKGTGSSPITDVAGNPLNGSGTPGSDINFTFVYNNAATDHIIYAGASSFVTDPTAAPGSRENPYPTIGQAITAATAGDYVAILPGTYTENVALKSLIRVVSAATSSTDAAYIPGNPLDTVIRAPATTGQNVTVSAINLTSVTGLPSSLYGVSIVSPLLGNQATGAIDPTSVGFLSVNSSVVLNNSIVINAGMGVDISESGANARTAFLQNDVIAGNLYGIVLNDAGASSLTVPADIDNNTIAFNSIGVLATVNTQSPVIGDLINNIFFSNHDTTATRGGAAIFANAPNKLGVISNLFYGNGYSDSAQGASVIGVGGNFIPSALGATPDSQGNFIGNPAFITPVDPRPNVSGPAVFFADANFDLTANSAAIDAATNGYAPPYDLLYRGRVRIPGRGFPGTGPADVGAYEFDGTGGIPNTAPSGSSTSSAAAAAQAAATSVTNATTASIPTPAVTAPATTTTTATTTSSTPAPAAAPTSVSFNPRMAAARATAARAAANRAAAARTAAARAAALAAARSRQASILIGARHPMATTALRLNRRG